MQFLTKITYVCQTKLYNLCPCWRNMNYKRNTKPKRIYKNRKLLTVDMHIFLERYKSETYLKKV